MNALRKWLGSLFGTGSEPARTRSRTGARAATGAPAMTGAPASASRARRPRSAAAATTAAPAPTAATTEEASFADTILMPAKQTSADRRARVCRILRVDRSGGRIRTGDFSLPKRARYQAAPRPDPLIVLAVAAADRFGGIARMPTRSASRSAGATSTRTATSTRPSTSPSPRRCSTTGSGRSSAATRASAGTTSPGERRSTTAASCGSPTGGGGVGRAGAARDDEASRPG